MSKNNQGIAILIIVIAIFIIGLAVGGVAYFIGSQSAPKESAGSNKVVQTAKETPAPVDEAALEKELNDTQLNEIDSDLKDIDRDVTSY
ncbi:hypothetical protein HYT59_02470 [Candidatus Woesebacteria bacterium]|nr:hypothetical protein [Candidatus Woesebacteria bacterium]